MSEPVIAAKSPVPVEVEEGKAYFWCACGQSKKQPFCDGSHAGSDFQPVKWIADATGRKFFCACKRTAGQPLCDGTHNGL